MFGFFNTIYSYVYGAEEAAAMPVEDAAAMPVEDAAAMPVEDDAAAMPVENAAVLPAEAYIDLINNNDKYIIAQSRMMNIRDNIRAVVTKIQDNGKITTKQKESAWVAYSRFKEQYKIERQKLDRKKEVMDAKVYERYGVPFSPRVG